MSFRSEYILSLAGRDFSNVTESDLRDLFSSVLGQGLHGLCFSPYMDGQSPGDVIDEEQICQRMEIIRPYTRWIRTFSVTDGNELIPKIARQNGLKTLVGAWLGEDEDKNREEIQNLIRLAREGYVDLAAVGNEVLYREDLPEGELLNYIREVKKAIPNVPVGYVDAYYEFCDRPELAEACDVIFANCYPFWEGCHIDYAFLYMKEMFHKATKAAKGKPVIISETGWPSFGSALESAEPSFSNAIKYFLNAQAWARQEGVEMFWFSAFDEAWKVGGEGDVGAWWGLWNKDGQLKFV